MQGIRAIIVPGNGNDSPEEKWRPYVTDGLEKMGIPTLNIWFPDPLLARKEYWLSFLEQLNADERTILIGHSSGAVASMRYAETHRILGSVLIGAYYTDLNLISEKRSGYFDEPWDWNSIRKNQQWIVQFASTDDPYIPIEEMRHIRDKLKTEYYEYRDEGHFGSDKNKTAFPELVDVIKKHVQA